MSQHALRWRLSALAAAVLAVSTSSAIAFSSGAAAQPTPGERGGTSRILGLDHPDAVPNEYIVTFKNQGQSIAASKTSATSMAKRHGGTVRYTYGSVVDGYSAKMTPAQAEAVAADPAVNSVQQVYEVSAQDTQSSPTWGLDRIDQANLPLSGSYTYPSNGGAGVHVYIVDSGVNTSHVEFTGRVGNGWDYVQGDSVPNDCSGHGTHVAGTAVGARYGVAKRATLHAMRVLNCEGRGTNAAIIAAFDDIRRSGQRPAVINYSIGCDTRCSDPAMDNAVTALMNSGVTFVQAAGNNNDNSCYYSPQHVANTITVGNSNRYDQKAGTSSWGSCVNLFAPGSSITSAWPTSTTAYNTISGTSMASPHVTGAAALYLGQNPTASPTQVGWALVNNTVTGRISGLPSGTPNRLLNTSFLN